ncbi:MAG: protein kinase domain-containing protein [Thermomicrobiales bacterium]
MPTKKTGFREDGGVPPLLGSRYEVEVAIGSGAFATTYRGRDQRLDRMVAIKILSREFAKDPTYVQRFEREAQTAASISHGNVVDVYDFGQEGDVLYIVMQYIAGEDLKHLITREGRLTPDRSREITLQILAGLGAIHQAGIVHRDIKPQNILIGTDGQARVADFGIAQIEFDSGLTTAGMAVGTAAYMAPEQAEGGRTTAATDVYSVGVVLYEMLTGVLPFTAPTPMALMLAHIQQRPVPPSQRANGCPIPADLDNVVMQAMAKAPQDRFRSAAAMSQALRASLGEGAQRTVATPATREGTVASPRAMNRSAPAPNLVPRTPSSTGPMRDQAAAHRAGAGLRAVLNGFLMLLVVAVLAGAAYLWWDGRNNEAAPGTETTPTATVEAIAPMAEVTATQAQQVIDPVATETPFPTETLFPTETPLPPTPEPTVETAPTIGPDGGGVVPATTEPIQPTDVGPPQVIEPAVPSPTAT